MNLTMSKKNRGQCLWIAVVKSNGRAGKGKGGQRHAGLSFFFSRFNSAMHVLFLFDFALASSPFHVSEQLNLDCIALKVCETRLSSAFASSCNFLALLPLFVVVQRKGDLKAK